MGLDTQAWCERRKGRVGSCGGAQGECWQQWGVWGTRVGAAAPLCRPGRAPHLSGEVLDTQPLATGSLGRQAPELWASRACCGVRAPPCGRSGPACGRWSPQGLRWGSWSAQVWPVAAQPLPGAQSDSRHRLTPEILSSPSQKRPQPPDFIDPLANKKPRISHFTQRAQPTVNGKLSTTLGREGLLPTPGPLNRTLPFNRTTKVPPAHGGWGRPREECSAPK